MEMTQRRDGAARVRGFAVLCAGALLALCLGGCGFTESKEKAGRSVDDFHAAYNAGEYEGIYAAAADEFRSYGTSAAFGDFMADVEGELGRHESSERTFFRGDYLEGGKSGHLEHGSRDTSLPIPPEVPGEGTFVYAEYESRFERAAATEQFLYRITDDGAELIWYHVTSPVFA